MRLTMLAGLIAALLCAACVSTITTYSIDEAGNPVVRVENHNLMRVGATAQVATYDPQTGVLSIAHVLAADEMSGTLGRAWSRLMDVAGYAIGGAALSAAAGGPTTPAAIGGALLGYAKDKLSGDGEDEDDQSNEGEEE